MSEPDRFPRRAQAARATRRRVLAAATELFEARGYAGTSIAAIAEAADVAEQTVYAAFGNKRTVLAEAVDSAIAGDDRPVAVNDRAWMQPVWDAPTPSTRLRAYAEAVGRIHRGAARLFAVLAVAAPSSPELHELWQQAQRRRRSGAAAVVGPMAERGELRAGLAGDEAVDIAWAMNGPELYLSLVGERRWSRAHYVRWLGDALARLLLEPGVDPGPAAR